LGVEQAIRVLITARGQFTRGEIARLGEPKTEGHSNPSTAEPVGQTRKQAPAGDNRPKASG
jgi:hypothetical protein